MHYKINLGQDFINHLATIVTPLNEGDFSILLSLSIWILYTKTLKTSENFHFFISSLSLVIGTEPSGDKLEEYLPFMGFTSLFKGFAFNYLVHSL